MGINCIKLNRTVEGGKWFVQRKITSFIYLFHSSTSTVLFCTIEDDDVQMALNNNRRQFMLKEPISENLTFQNLGFTSRPSLFVFPFKINGKEKPITITFAHDFCICRGLHFFIHVCLLFTIHLVLLKHV